MNSINKHLWTIEEYVVIKAENEMITSYCCLMFCYRKRTIGTINIDRWFFLSAHDYLFKYVLYIVPIIPQLHQMSG